jgi:hypothetical protein
MPLVTVRRETLRAARLQTQLVDRSAKAEDVTLLEITEVVVQNLLG